MPRPHLPSHRRWIALPLFACLGSIGARADEAHFDRVPLLPTYRQECSACHLPYPPGMLPAASWRRLMTNLPQHFGSDASLDAASVKALSDWLAAHAAANHRAEAAPPQDRITRSAWFLREHRAIRPEVWMRPAVGSAANCAACHTRAAQGRFDEHDLRIPGSEP